MPPRCPARWPRQSGWSDAPSVSPAARRRGVDGRPSTGLLNGRFVAYRYEPQLRYAGRPDPSNAGRPQPEPVGEAGAPSSEGTTPPFPKLPDVDDSVKQGRTYLCAEMVVRTETPGFGELVYLVLAEVETGSILYIECQTCFVNGMVFKYDPKVVERRPDGDVRRQ